MLNSTERECITKFLGYVSREFGIVCREYAVNPAVIKTRIINHKTENNKFRACPLTQRQQAVLSGFLRERITELRSWLSIYELNEKQLFNAIKGMTR